MQNDKKRSNRTTKSIILINGRRLVDLMIRYNLGTRTTIKYEIKEIDTDYFEPEI